MLPHLISAGFEGFFLLQNWESEDASRVQAGVWSRCKETARGMRC